MIDYIYKCKKPLVYLLGLIFFTNFVKAQDGDVLLNHELYHYIDRIDIKGVTNKSIPTDVRPYARERVSEILQSIDTNVIRKRDKAQQHRSRMEFDDNYIDSVAKANYKPFPSLIAPFYRNRRDFLGYTSPKLKLYANPILYLSAGQDQAEFETVRTNTNILRNTRGVALRGSLFGKVGFYTDILETQSVLPLFITRSVQSQGVLAGEGYLKNYKTNGYDFLGARGYLTYSPAKFMRIKFGRDRAFWGNGVQSLSLSDHATDYLLLNVVTQFWKFEYVNHFAQMIDFLPNKPDAFGTYPRKYAAYHALFFRPIKQISIGVFESVLHSPILPSGQRGFELQYLNPIIFYRSVEQYIGSPDNSALGLTLKANILKRFRLYGQVLIDDYNLSMRKEGNGWWGNKTALQAGLMAIDVLGIETLDLQVEYNQVRPYTYAHYNPITSFSHYRQNLGHTLGANLQELNTSLRYQPIPRLFVFASAMLARQGVDSTGRNFGANILRPDFTHNNGEANPDFNNTIGQGIQRDLVLLNGKLAYQLFYLNLWVELECLYRTDKIGATKNQSLAAFLALRWNIPHKPIRF